MLKRKSSGKLARTASGRRAQCGEGCLPWHQDSFPFWPDQIRLSFGLNTPGPSDCCWQDSIKLKFSTPFLGAMGDPGGATLLPTLRGLFTANYRLVETVLCTGASITLVHQVGLLALGGDLTTTQFTLTLDIGIPMEFLNPPGCALPLRFPGCEAYRAFDGTVLGTWDVCAHPVVLFSGAVTVNYMHPTFPCSATWVNYSFAAEPI